MKFDVTAVVKEIGEIETVGAKGFQKRNLILSETNGQYENLICVEFSGKDITTPEQCSVGQMVTVSGFINCREWNGKYFTSLKGTFINQAQETSPNEYPQSFPQPEDLSGVPNNNQMQQFSQQTQPTYESMQQSFTPDTSNFTNTQNVDTDIPF